jgi:hypothetical protein
MCLCGSHDQLLCICCDESSLPQRRDAEPPRRFGIKNSTKKQRKDIVIKLCVLCHARVHPDQDLCEVCCDEHKDIIFHGFCSNSYGSDCDDADDESDMGGILVLRGSAKRDDNMKILSDHVNVSADHAVPRCRRRIRKIMKKTRKAVVKKLCLWCPATIPPGHNLCGNCVKEDEGMDYAGHCSDGDLEPEFEHDDDADPDMSHIQFNCATLSHSDGFQLYPWLP